MKHSIAITAALCLALTLGNAFAQSPKQPTTEQQRTLAQHRASTLTRGVNLSGWFGGWGDYSPEHTTTYITADDFAAMHAMGIRYVRFPLEPMLLSRGGLLAPGKDAMWKRIDDALDLAMNAGLSVDFVVFPNSDYKQKLNTQSGADQFLILWQVLAKHLANRDPDRLFFELMNEDEMQDPYRWIGIESAVVHAIRQIDTQHTIIASGAHYDSIPDLIQTEPIADANTIYSFHFYEPYPFTHQGAPWGSIEWNYFKNIPYPATAAQIAPLLPTIPTEDARYQLYQFGEANWNAKTIAGRIAFAADWAREHQVAIICNEFGAFRDTAPAASRTRYLHDVRTGLEQNGIGWAMWDWSGNFGLVTRQDGHPVADPANLEALGLR